MEFHQFRRADCNCAIHAGFLQADPQDFRPPLRGRGFQLYGGFLGKHRDFPETDGGDMQAGISLCFFGESQGLNAQTLGLRDQPDQRMGVE